MKDMSRAYNFISQNFFFWVFAFWGKWQFGLFSLTFEWSCGAQRTSCWRPISTYLRSVGYSSTVTTSREFQAEMVNPLYRHSMPIIMDSLVPNQRKKQLIPESTIEPPANEADTAGTFPVILVEQRPSGSLRSHSKTESQEEATAWVHKAQVQVCLLVYKVCVSNYLLNTASMKYTSSITQLCK